MTRPEDIDAYMTASAALLGLDLSQESRAAVAANLVLLFDRAGEFADLPLEEALDPGALLRL